MINTFFYETKVSMLPKAEGIRYDPTYFKFKVMKFAIESNNSNAVSFLGVNEKQVREWQKQKVTRKTIPRTHKANNTNHRSGHYWRMMYGDG